MRFLALLLGTLGLSAGTLAHAANPEKLATVEISVDDAALLKKGAGIRTLFVIVYDADSAMPMPYGAMKVDLKADASGSVYKGELNTGNVQLMGARPMPKNLRIKARLDKDGAAGKDQAGDLVGLVEKVKVGESAKIVINSAI